MTRRLLLTLLGCVAALALVTAGCGGDDASSGGGGLITADGSSTVGPFTTKAAEDWKAAGGGDVTVGTSGTGGGFEKFCAGETDISNASRPIEDDEEAALRGERHRVRRDPGRERRAHERREPRERLGGVPHGRAAQEDLGARREGGQLEPGRPVVPGRPAQALRRGHRLRHLRLLHRAINGEEGASRSDYTATEDDNVTVQGVAGDQGALGYFGLSYYEENQDKLKALEVDGGAGCVAPSARRFRTARTRRSPARCSST